MTAQDSEYFTVAKGRIVSFVQKYWYWICAGTAMLILGGLFLPSGHSVVLTYGTDTYDGHMPLFGKRVVRQEVEIFQDITHAGALLVNLRRAQNLSPVGVRVLKEDGTVLAQGTIESHHIIDDAFAWAPLSSVVRREEGRIIIELTAPEATNQNAIGVRFDKEDTQHIAVGVVERVPVWKQFLYWRQAHPQAAWNINYALGGGIVAVVLGMTILSGSHLSRTRYFLWSLVAIVCFALLVRIPLMKHVDSVFGGDAYNYVLKSRAWLQGEDVFSSDARKGPFMPFLLLPGFLTSDPLMWARYISMTAAVVAVGIIILLAKELGAPPFIALTAGLFVSIARDFRWESVHGLANILYASLIVAASYALLKAIQKPVAGYIASILVGLTTLTRYEGGLVAAFYVPALWWYRKWRISALAHVLLPIGIFFALPFVLWPFTGHIGVRTPSDITADTGLSLALSWHEWVLNLKLFKLFFGSTWIFTDNLGKQAAAFIVGVGLGIVCCLRSKIRTSSWWMYLYSALPFMASAWILALIIRDADFSVKYLTLSLATLTGMGVGRLLFLRPTWSIPVLGMVVAQIVVVTLILPKGRYYVQLIPFMALSLAFGIEAISSIRPHRFTAYGSFFLIGILTSLILFNGNDALGNIVNDYNSRSQENTVMMRAAKQLRPLPGFVALSTDDLSMRVFIGDTRMKVYPPILEGEKVSKQDVERWLEATGAAYVVESSFNPLFSFLPESPDTFEEIGHFSTPYGRKTATVYRVVQE